MTALQPAFRALADPTRRDILRLLSASDMTVGQVAGKFQMTRAAVKKHLVILEEGDLIATRRSGRETINSLNAQALRPVFDWIGYFDRFWDDRLSDLKSTLENGETPE
ncbi:MAG: metalloregulator ArsR/SmtB family transcription factor [Pseudomonadota bacterium]